MSFITVSGENQIAKMQGTGKALNIVNFVLANIPDLGAEPVDRAETMPARADIAVTLPVTKSGYVNGNQVVYSLTMDSSAGDFDFNWIGLVDDESVLIAVSYVELISKIATAGGVPGNNLTRNFLITYSGIAATTALEVPAQTWQIDFNARLHGIDERARLSALDRYGAQAFYADGWLVRRQGLSGQYDISVGVGFVGGIRIENSSVQTLTAPPSTSIWLDVSLQGDISDVSAVVDVVVSASLQNNHVDDNKFNHYLIKIAEIGGSGAVTDLRIDADFLAVHIDAADPHPQYLVQQEADVRYESINAVSNHEDKVNPHPQYHFPAGTLMLFQQPNAPIGWTRQTAHDDKALRVVSGAAGVQSGGYLPFSTVFSRDHTDGHTLTVNQMPAHKHGLKLANPRGPRMPVRETYIAFAAANYEHKYPSGTFISEKGGSASHQHNINLQVQYVDLIIASKDS